MVKEDLAAIFAMWDPVSLDELSGATDTDVEDILCNSDWEEDITQ